MPQAADELRLVRVTAMREVAIDVMRLDLRPADGRPLPGFDAGAHVDVHTPNGLVRQYSLCGAPATGEVDGYTIAVKHERAGRGGSASLHRNVEVGSLLGVSAPRNHFPLAADAGHSILIAGGIGITPIYAMIQALEARGKSWELHYCARSEGHAAFYADLTRTWPERVEPYFSETPILPVDELLARIDVLDDNTHVYCCGPGGLMRAVQAAAPAAHANRVHFEWFVAPKVEGDNEAFEVQIASSGAVFEVPPEQSALEVLREHGVDIPSSCEEGVCGSCEVRVLDGHVDHRDALLTDEERQANRCMMVCVSRARHARIVLDL